MITFDYHPVRMITICDLLFSGLITLMIFFEKEPHTHNSQKKNSEKRTKKKFFFTFLCGGGREEGCANKCLFNNLGK